MPLGFEVDALRVGTLGVSVVDICRWPVVQKLMFYKSGALKNLMGLGCETRTRVSEMVQLRDATRCTRNHNPMRQPAFPGPTFPPDYP